MVTAIIILVFVPVGIFLFFEATGDHIPDEDIFIGVMIGVSILAILLIPGVFALRWLREQSIRNTGTPARAKILNIEDTGVLINDCPVYELHLEVHPPWDQVFETTTEYCVRSPGLPSPKPGAEIPVFWVPGTTVIVIADE